MGSQAALSGTARQNPFHGQPQIVYSAHRETVRLIIVNVQNWKFKKTSDGSGSIVVEKFKAPMTTRDCF